VRAEARTVPRDQHQGGPLVDIDPDMIRSWLFGHATGTDPICSQMAAAGYRLEQRHDVLPQRAFLVFAAGA
jgi:hypothetical protein